ncbi:MAG: ATP-binding protein [Sporichthyaceae bacterium]
MTAAPVEVGVLGPLQLCGRAGTVELGSASQRLLLAALVLRRGRLVRLDELCDVLWGQEQPPTAVVSLRSHLTRLRGALSAAGASADALRWRDPGYVLAAGAVDCDADLFEDLTLRARSTADPRQAAETLREAMELWRGPAFAEFAEQPFAVAAVARLEDLRLGATEDLCAALLRIGNAAEALARIDPHLAAHPLREQATELRMRALYRLGRQAEALGAYRRTRSLFAAELGIEPSPALRDLEGLILRQDPVLTGPTLPRAHEFAPTGRTPYVGRAAERAMLDGLLDSTVRGAGGLVLIGGEPGVGKTRLAEETLARAAARGFVVYAGHCYEAAGAAPFVALVEIMEAALARAPSPAAWRAFLGDEAAEIARLLPRLRTLCPDVPPPLEVPPEQERRLLFTSLREVVARRARQTPLVLLFDDVQWADDGTLRCLEHLAEWAGVLPLLLIATYRDNEVDAGRPLAQTFEDLRRRRLAQWCTLGRLPEDEVGAILGALAGQEAPAPLVSAVYSGAEGNPFFVEEVYSDLAEQGRLFDADGRFRTDLTIGRLGVPAGVRLVVGRRLARLAKGTLPVLAAAAVAGRAFTVELLECVEGLDVDAVLDAVEDAGAARVIVPAPDTGGEDRFIFGHELIRQTVLGELSLTRRRRLHARVADARIRHYAERLDHQAATIAHHLLEAGQARASDAFGWLVEAGRFALAGSAFEEAVRHFERAAGLPGVGDPAERADLHYQRGNALAGLGRTDAAVQAWQSALDAYDALGDTDALGRSCVVAAYNLVFLARWAESVAIAERGLAALGEQASEARGRLLGLVAFPMAYAGRRVHAGGMVAEELELASTLSDDALLADALVNEAYVAMAHMEHRQLLASGARACDLLRASGDTWNLVKVAGAMGYAAVGLGEFDLARSLVGEFLPLAEKLGHHNPISQFTRSIGVVEFATSGSIARIERLGHEDRALQDGLGLPWPSGWSWLGLAAFYRGDWDAALPLFREAARREPPGALSGWNAAMLLEGLAYGGQRAEALELLDAATLPDPAQPETKTWGATQMLVYAAEALYVLGERDRAAALYPALVEVFERTGAVCPSYDDARLWERAAGIAALAGGQWDLAERHFVSALEQARALPHLFEVAHTRRWHGVLLQERGGDGSVPLNAAFEDYDQLAMPRHREACRALQLDCR